MRPLALALVLALVPAWARAAIAISSNTSRDSTQGSPVVVASIPAGSVVLIRYAGFAGSGTPPSVGSFASSNLTFTSRASNSVGWVAVSQVATAVASSTLTNESISITPGANTDGWMVIVTVITGADTSALTNTVASSVGYGTAKDISISAVGSTSWFFSVMAAVPVTFTVGTDTTADSANRAYALWAHNTTPGSGTLYVRSSVDASATDTYAGIEIREAAASGNTYNDTISQANVLGHTLTSAYTAAATISDGVTAGQTSTATAVVGASTSDLVAPDYATTLNLVLSSAFSQGVTPDHAHTTTQSSVDVISEPVGLAHVVSASASIVATADDGVTLGFTESDDYVPAGGSNVYNDSFTQAQLIDYSLAVGASVAVPVAPFGDDFNRADSADLGPLWTKAPGTQSAMQIINNKMSSGPTGFIEDNGARWAGIDPGPDFVMSVEHYSVVVARMYVKSSAYLTRSNNSSPWTAVIGGSTQPGAFSTTDTFFRMTVLGTLWIIDTSTNGAAWYERARYDSASLLGPALIQFVRTGYMSLPSTWDNFSVAPIVGDGVSLAASYGIDAQVVTTTTHDVALSDALGAFLTATDVCAYAVEPNMTLVDTTGNVYNMSFTEAIGPIVCPPSGGGNTFRSGGTLRP